MAGNPIKYKDPAGHCELACAGILTITAADVFFGTAMVATIAKVVYDNRPSVRTMPRDDTQPRAIPVADSIPDDKQRKLPPEIYYRAMSDKDYSILRRTGFLPPLENKETSISQTPRYNSTHTGHFVRFEMKPGTTAKLHAIETRDNQKELANSFPYSLMPIGRPGWYKDDTRFKYEGKQITTQLGTGPGIIIFNANMLKYQKIGYRSTSGKR
ncbi:hypothetical protein LEP1GSC061_3959 [Leptospira wolffii serovar Khorat str. Khorat-H2]|nr:hypothetical protein LEP1GSC061_3959 [Leptospira wolffii serovar Khorat str. Khorat-H2]